MKTQTRTQTSAQNKNEIPLFDTNGKEIDKLKLPKALLGSEVNVSLLHIAVKMSQNNSRTKLAATKTRGNVRGGGKKPWRQKGTGRARVGSSRNPIWKGGGVTFGPVPRNSHYSIPKKMKQQALKNSLIDKLLENKFIVLDKIKLEEPKTKLLCAVLKAIRVKEKSLLLISKVDQYILRAAGNLPHLEVQLASDVNAYDVLRFNKLILTKAALEKIVERIK